MIHALGSSGAAAAQQEQQQGLHACLRRLLAIHGLDITHQFSVQSFNSQSCPEEHKLPTFSRNSTLGIIVGNTNALWPQFVRHLAAHTDELHVPNPLDSFVEAVIKQAVQQCCHAALPTYLQQAVPAGTKPFSPLASHDISSHERQKSISVEYAIRFSHHTEPGKFVNMMRAAQLSGLAYFSDATHLCIHPVYGPWFALRAVVVFNADGPDGHSSAKLPCPDPVLEREAAQQMQHLEAAGGFSNWQQHWHDWAMLRAIGAKNTDPSFTYSQDQLEYHYTKNKAILQRAVAALQQQQQQQLQKPELQLL